LHCIVMTYPARPSAKKQQEMVDFLKSFGRVLPCKICRKNFDQYLQKNPIRAETRIKLRDWVIDLHNAINKRLGKRVLSHTEAVNEIKSMCHL
jgi:FAD-linked sulfhydryl oxidase